MKGINNIFFDLDHTLWDYDRSARETLQELLVKFRLEDRINDKKFVKVFYDVNHQLWHLYNIGEVNRDQIRDRRFRLILEKLNINGIEHEELSDFFINECPQKSYLMPDAEVALNYLQGKYHLHIITNGFEDSQHKKLRSSFIEKYFKYVITSESAQARKPDPRIFKFSLDLSGATAGESVMIGDNPLTDIKGARDMGLRTIFYNPKSNRKSESDFEIISHLELLKLF